MISTLFEFLQDVFQDFFTRWIEVLPLRNANGATITRAFKDLVITLWGTPKFLFTDNGTEFCNKIVDLICQEDAIKRVKTPPYHPQVNPVERIIRVLKTMIISFIKETQRKWDVHLNDFCFAFNTAYHSSLKTSPSFLNCIFLNALRVVQVYPLLWSQSRPTVVPRDIWEPSRLTWWNKVVGPSEPTYLEECDPENRLARWLSFQDEALDWPPPSEEEPPLRSQEELEDPKEPEEAQPTSRRRHRGRRTGRLVRERRIAELLRRWRPT